MFTAYSIMTRDRFKHDENEENSIVYESLLTQQHIFIYLNKRLIHHFLYYLDVYMTLIFSSHGNSWQTRRHHTHLWSCCNCGGVPSHHLGLLVSIGPGHGLDSIHMAHLASVGRFRVSTSVYYIKLHRDTRFQRGYSCTGTTESSY